MRDGLAMQLTLYGVSTRASDVMSVARGSAGARAPRVFRESLQFEIFFPASRALSCAANMQYNPKRYIVVFAGSSFPLLFCYARRSSIKATIDPWILLKFVYFFLALCTEASWGGVEISLHFNHESNLCTFLFNLFLLCDYLKFIFSL